MKHYSLLVPCESLVLTGGLLRFERLGIILKDLGHKMCFVPFTKQVDPNFKTMLSILSIEEASKLKWDAVMIPGAGFSEEVIERFETFCDAKYGVRVQHVLNDKSKKNRFMKVNCIFQPDIVIFNNPDWVLGEHNEIQAKSFHHLFGAVDTKQFYPKPNGKNDTESWLIGGLSNKNPQPLIKALKRLPKTYCVKLFGPKQDLDKKFPILFREGRLQLVGSLPTDDLTAFYHSVDCVVHTEKHAGWANLVAEGMACGLPVICTTHGTQAFVTHGKNAIVLDESSPERIAEKIMNISKDPITCERLASAGRQTMIDFSWDRYARNLLNLIFDYSSTGTTKGNIEPPRNGQRCEVAE